MEPMAYDAMIQGALDSLEMIKGEIQHFRLVGENGCSRQYVAAIHDYLVDIPTFEKWWDGGTQFEPAMAQPQGGDR